MNALLCVIHFNINNNYILPKSCTLILLRFTKEDDKNTEGEDYREGQSEESVITFDSQKLWWSMSTFFEILSSLLSNGILAEYF